MGGRAQRYARGTITPEDAADVMIDSVTKYVAKKLSEARPKLGNFEADEVPSLEDWADYKRLQSQLERLLAQTQFITSIMTEEVE